MKLKQNPSQHRPTSPNKGVIDRFKDTASQTLQKTKEVVSQQSNKLKSLFQHRQNSSTTHADDNKAQESIGRGTSQYDAAFAQRSNLAPAAQSTPMMDTGGGGASMTSSRQLEEGVVTEPVPPTETNAGETLPNGINPTQIHLNLFDGDPNGSNSDCGPTSMAMALQGVGLNPEGADASSSSVDTVTAMRQSMYPEDETRDGVEVNAEGETVRKDEEHSNWTDFTGLITGAEAAGAEVNQITPNSDDIAQSVQDGKPVVVNGNPGEDGGDWSSSYNSGHFITVSGYNPDAETFTINDPLDDAPREVSKEQLDNYMDGWSWRALKISNPNATPPGPATPPPLGGPMPA